MYYIYHYTKANTFEKIISSKTFYLMDHQGMEDKNEIKWLFGLVEKAIEDLFLEKLTSKEYERLQYFKRAYIKIMKNRIAIKNHYMICFSQKENIVNQWELYADNHKGIAIVFNLNFSEELIGLISKAQSNTENNRPSTQKIGYEYVVYDDGNEIKNMIRDILKQEYYDANHYVVFINELQSFIKHPQYYKEDEIRIIYTPENTKNFEINRQYNNILKRISNKKIIGNRKYYELDFSCIHNSLLIPKVIRGKECEMSYEKVRKILDENGFKDTSIELGLIP